MDSDGADDRLDKVTTSIARTMSGWKGWEKVYDVKSFQFRNVMIPICIYVLTMFIVTMWGIWNDVPSFLFISYHGLAIAAASLVHDHWISNSLTAALVPPYIIVASVDVITGNMAMAWHLPLIVMAILVSTRYSVSLPLMVASTTWYVFWIYAIKRWIDYPYYDCSFTAPWDFICGDAFQSISVLALGIAFSVALAWRSYKAKQRGRAIDCPGTQCPW